MKNERILRTEIIAKFSCEEESFLVDVFEKKTFIFKSENSIYNDTREEVKKIAQRIAKKDFDDNYTIKYKNNYYQVNAFDTEV